MSNSTLFLLSLSTRRLQMALNEKAQQRLVADGDKGPKTTNALKAFQISQGLPGTGEVTSQTIRALDPQYSQKYLAIEHFEYAQKTLNCEMAAVLALFQVESSGQGFIPDGRVSIQFERHQFYRELQKVMSLTELSKLAAANPNIVGVNPGGYGSDTGDHDRLALAVKINAQAAYKATSWGLGQVMGFNYPDDGYKNVESFVSAMKTSEWYQLKAMVAFILKRPILVTALRNRDFKTFAAGYNGPNYAKDNYDGKLKEAYDKYRK